MTTKTTKSVSEQSSSFQRQFTLVNHAVQVLNKLACDQQELSTVAGPESFVIDKILLCLDLAKLITLPM